MPAPPPHQVDKHLLNFGIIVRSVEDKAGVLLISHLGCVSYRTCESWCVEAVCLAVLVVGGLIVFVSFASPGFCISGGKGGRGEPRGAWRGFDGLAVPVAGSDSLRYRGTGQGSGGSPQPRPQRQLGRRRDMVGAQPPPPQRASMDSR